MKLKVVTSLLALSALLSCTKRDNELPKIEYIVVNGVPYNSRVNAGQDIVIEIGAKDNRELKNVTIEIMPEGILESKNEFFVLDFTDTKGMSGKNGTESINFRVPSNVTAGLYNMNVVARDVTGNASGVVKYELIVQNNAHAPQIKAMTMTEGNVDGTSSGTLTYFTSRGRTLKFNGKITDDKGITEIRLRIVNKYNTFEFDGIQYLEESDAIKEFNMDSVSYAITVPETAITDDHRIQWMVKDTDGHLSFKQAKLDIRF